MKSKAKTLFTSSYWERLELDAGDDPCDFWVTIAAFLIKDRWKLEGIS